MPDIVAGAEHPLAAAAGASAAAMNFLFEAPSVDAEILALWIADLVLAQRLGWDAPVPLLATAIAHASLRRGPSRKRPRPADPDWVDAAAGAYAMAAQEAFALAGELSRRSQALSGVKTQIARQGRGTRSSNSCSATTRFLRPGAAKSARLSGRPNFRLYGL